MLQTVTSKQKNGDRRRCVTCDQGQRRVQSALYYHIVIIPGGVTHGCRDPLNKSTKELLTREVVHNKVLDMK